MSVEESLFEFCSNINTVQKGIEIGQAFIAWRGFTENDATLDKFWLTYSLLFLHGKGLLDSSMNELQVFKRVLLYFVDTEWDMLYGTVSDGFQLYLPKELKEQMKCKKTNKQIEAV